MNGNKPINIIYINGPNLSNALPNDIVDWKLGFCANDEINFNQRLNEHKRHTFGGMCLERFETDLTDGPINRWLKSKFPDRAKTQNGVGHEVYRSTVENCRFLIDQVTRYINGIDTGRAKANRYDPRKEQSECIEKTITYMTIPENWDKPFLWNCKMRFGKTFTFYELVMQMNLRNVLIITRRPTDTKTAWIDDTDHIDFDFGANDIIDSSKQLGPIVLKSEGRNIVFASFQDLDDLTKPKFANVINAQWDMIVIDEAHFGADTKKAKQAISKLNRKYPLLLLSGTPFKMLDTGDLFDDSNVYTWSYIDEQKARKQEIAELGEEQARKTGQYYWYPTMKPYVIDIADMDVFSESALFSDDEGFTFTKLFASEEINGKLQFKNERFVKEFLDYLCTPKMPYGHQSHLFFDKVDTQHVLMYLPGVKECSLLKRLMENHRVLKDYTIIPAYDDNEGMNKDTVALIKEKIGSIDMDRKKGTITLTCGKCTHGVSIPEWGSVFCLSDLSSSQIYFQLIFRGQTPRRPKDAFLGKEHCAVFDFSPTRTLSHYHSLASAMAKNGDVKSALREILAVMNPICFDGNELKAFSIEDVFNNFKFGYASRGLFYNFFRNIQVDIDQELIEEIRDFDVSEVSKNVVEIGDHKIAKGKNSKKINVEGNDIELDDEDNSSDQEEKLTISEDQAKQIVAEGLSRMPLLLKVSNGDTIESVLGQLNNLVCKSLTGLTLRALKAIFLGQKNVARSNEINTVIGKFRFQEKSELKMLFEENIANMHLHDQLPNPRFNPGDSFEIVKTPSKLAAKMLAEIPTDVWKDETKKWLMPVSKSGVFELQIFRRLMVGLEGKIPDKDERRDHIVKNMIWSFCPTMASFVLSRNYFVEGVYGKREEVVAESNVYQMNFLDERDVVVHSNGEMEMKKQGKFVKFDVIVGNPPYQESIGQSGNTSSAVALYPDFVEKAIECKPQYMSMVIPAKWMTGGGRGTSKFLEKMVECKELSKITTISDAREWFPDIDLKGGVMFFLMEQNKNNHIVMIDDHKFDLSVSDVIITDKIVLSIKDKLLNKCNTFFSDVMYGQTPYGIKTNHSQWSNDKNNSYICHYFNKKNRGRDTNLIDRALVSKNNDTISKWKLCIAKASGKGKDGTGRAFIAAPETIVTQSYYVLACFTSEVDANNALKYIHTPFAQFISSILKSAQSVSGKVFRWLPYLDFTKSYTNQDLYTMFDLTKEEIAHIENTTKDFPIFRKGENKKPITPM